MKQIGLTLMAIVLIVTTALPAIATGKGSKISSRATFAMATIPGNNICC